MKSNKKEEIKKQDKIRKANIIFAKNGNGFVTTKITLPVPWIKKLGFDIENRNAIIELNDNKIVIKKDNN